MSGYQNIPKMSVPSNAQNTFDFLPFHKRSDPLHTFQIHPDIRKAHTLPASFYQEDAVFVKLRDKVFARSWQWVGHKELLPLEGHGRPFRLLDPFLPEPMLLNRDDSGKLHCISNVCTHRGNLLLQHPARTKQIQCLYHGRRFDQDGSFRHMPEFEDAEDFPSACDHLKRYPLKQWGPFLFTSIEPAIDFENIRKELDSRLGFLPIGEMTLRPEYSRDYLVHAHWALYCDNYLEGFHIPFVHADLNVLLDYSSYSTELFEHFNLQIGYGQKGSPCFDLPAGHPDYGKDIAAYYYWLFPNIMLNFYPWGLSVNVVKPISPTKTRVSFYTYLLPDNDFDFLSEGRIDKVEREDEAVVESVQKGLQSMAYQSGRFSPTREKGVHHFHRLLAQFLER